MEYKPHPYQQYAIDRVISEKHIGLLLDMGLGKTSIMLSAINELVNNRFEVSRVLVIAPKKVAEATWQNEAAKWDGMSALRFSTILGDRKSRISALETKADVYVINRENVQWLCEYYDIQKLPWDFDMLVFDESSSFKNPQSKRFKSIRKKLFKTDRTVILTGTPAPNGLEDLWAQIYLLDMGERLGRYITHYRDRYFDFHQWTHSYTPKLGAFESIQKRIGDICMSMSADDYLQLEDMIIDDVVIQLDKATQKRYRDMERSMILSVDDGDITVLSAAALTNKLLQLCSGAVYDEEHGVHEVHDCKTEMLTEVFEQLHGETALVFYAFKYEPAKIREAAKSAGIAENEICELNGAKDVDDWNAGKIKVLIAHPASCGYGLNLQSGGHHIVWYTPTWNLELYQQANARLHRQGQTKPTIIHRLLVKGGIDEDVVKALNKKDASQDALLRALKARVAKVR